MSLRGSASLPSTCSGDMYSRVPAMCPRRVMGSTAPLWVAALLPAASSMLGSAVSTYPGALPSLSKDRWWPRDTQHWCHGRDTTVQETIVGVSFGVSCVCTDVRYPAAWCVLRCGKASRSKGDCTTLRFGAPSCNLLKRDRNPMLYPFELRARFVCILLILQRYSIFSSAITAESRAQVEHRTESSAAIALRESWLAVLM